MSDKPEPKPLPLTCALVDQVMKAAAGGNERNVVTFITLPMWQAFLREIGENDAQLPHAGLSVFGSQTHVVLTGGGEMVAASRRIP